MKLQAVKKILAGQKSVKDTAKEYKVKEEVVKNWIKNRKELEEQKNLKNKNKYIEQFE